MVMDIRPNKEGSAGITAPESGIGVSESKPNGGVKTNLTARTYRPIVSKHVKDWDRTLTVLNRGHWDAARDYESWDTLLGGATFVTGFIAGSAAFTQLSEYAANRPGYLWVQVMVGVFALIAGLLGAAQSKSGLSNLAAVHKSAGQKFGMLRRELDEYQEIGFSSMESEAVGLKAFREKWDAVESEVPPVPERSMNKAKRETE
jgi:hypothetical protein